MLFWPTILNPYRRTANSAAPNRHRTPIPQILATVLLFARESAIIGVLGVVRVFLVLEVGGGGGVSFANLVEGGSGLLGVVGVYCNCCLRSVVAFSGETIFRR